ncbi:MAG: hypothetical protein EON56_01570 [Alphaproteobacteria bacterium]|nr:MAG: hypothetical protein EON56_01570 [Alphaproteobacteria bacterium]
MSKTKRRSLLAALLLAFTFVGVFFWWHGQHGTSQTALLMGSEAAKLIQFGRPPYPTKGVWTPSFREIKAMESGAAEFLDTQQKDYNNGGKPFKDYQRQCTGIIHQGQKKIFVYAFFDTFPDWQTHFRTVFDGGESFFRFTYDVVLKKYEDFSTNGRSITT